MVCARHLARVGNEVGTTEVSMHCHVYLARLTTHCPSAGPGIAGGRQEQRGGGARVPGHAVGRGAAAPALCKYLCAMTPVSNSLCHGSLTLWLQ